MNHPPQQQQVSEALDRARRMQHASREHASAIYGLYAIGCVEEAAALLVDALAAPAGAPPDHEALAFAAFQLGRHEIAREFYARVVTAAPRDALAWYNLATSDRNLGRLRDAEEECDRALRLAPDLAAPALLRSQLRTQTAECNHVGALRSALSAGPAANAKVFLHHALGKEYDDLGEYDLAFEHFALGAAARRATLRYDVQNDLHKLQRIEEAFGAQVLTNAPPLLTPSYGFIVGLPRSGTTMIERILTNGLAARSNGETDHLFAALNEAASAAGSDVFERVAQADSTHVRSAYARRAGRAQVGRPILEKLPFNYLYAGAIRLTLPNARTLFVTRAPADNCLAMFSTLFGSGYPFSYTLVELAEYYIAYERLLAHWRTTVGEQLLEVAYEDVVADPGGKGRAIATHFGIAWRDEMIRIENNSAASATASAAQVRSPIYVKAKGRWRNYATHLRPLMERLERAGIDPTRGT